MKKTFSISIANTLFNIEEDAYQALDAYLSSIKKHFSDNEDEILKDIEARIAERFSEKPGKIITIIDVNKITIDMGSVNQFDDTEKENNDNVDNFSSVKKQLYRDTDNAIIAGVSSGLGHYFGIDRTIIRLIFMASLFIGGFGFLVYVILWFVVPEAKTATQKLEMRGAPVNLATVSSFVKDKFESMGINESKKGVSKNIESFFLRFSRGIAKIIQKVIFPSIRILFGSFFILIGFLMALGVTIAIVVASFGLPFVFYSFPVEGITYGTLFYFSIFAIYFSILIPFILLFFGGLHMVQKKSHLGGAISFSLLVIWFIAIATSGVTLSRIAVENNNHIGTNLIFVNKTENIVLEPFSKVSIFDSIRVNYIQGDSYEAKISASQYDVDRLSLIVSNDELVVKRTVGQHFCFILCPNRKVSIDIISPTISEININDASRLEGKINNEKKFTLNIRDASSANMDIIAETLITSVRYASSLTLRGAVINQDVTVTDASRYKGIGLISDIATILVADASSADVYVNKIISVNVHNASSLYYLGDPIFEKKEIYDASSLKVFN